MPSKWWCKSGKANLSAPRQLPPDGTGAVEEGFIHLDRLNRTHTELLVFQKGDELPVLRTASPELMPRQLRQFYYRPWGEW